MKKRGKKSLGYYMKKPMFPCIRELRPLLGSQDAAIQTNTIALRHFEEFGSKIEGGIDSYLKKKADEYKISHGANNFEYVKSKIAESNIINTFNIVDYFFKKFIKEYREFKNIEANKWVDKDNQNRQLDALNQLYKNLSSQERNLLYDKPEFHLLDYYRLVRNSLVHISDSDSDISKLDEKHNKLIERYGRHFEEHYKVLPNKKIELKYEDYFLYTRAMKYFINIVNDAGDLTFDEIAKVALKDKSFSSKLRRVENIKVRGIRARRIAYIKGYFRAVHGYGDVKKQAQEFFEYFKIQDKINWD